MSAPVVTKTDDRNLERAVAWVRAIESGQTGDALADFVTPDVIHEDMPNRIFPNGSRSDLAAMRAASTRGQTIMRRQRYDIRSATGNGSMEFRDGRICRQRDYCCYEPIAK
jgi:hypothetical protein